MNIGMNYVFKVNTIEADQKATVVQAASDGKNYVTFNIPRGAKGDKGDQGIQGIQGVEGKPGDRGPEGKQGPQGNPGKPFSISKVFKSKAEMKGDGYLFGMVKSLTSLLICLVRLGCKGLRVKMAFKAPRGIRVIEDPKVSKVFQDRTVRTLITTLLRSH